MGQYQVEVCQDEIIEGKCYFIIEMGNSYNSKKMILDYLLQQRPGWEEVCCVDDAHVILVFCIISSRAGTDIDAALNQLKSFPETNPAIFMVLHHTFDPEKIIPDSSRYVTRRNTLTVDLLFHEDSGLLKCNRNDESLTKIVQRFKYQDQSNAVMSICSTLWWILTLMMKGVYCIYVKLQSGAAAIFNYIRGPDRKRQTE